MKPKPILTQHKYPSFINNATIFEKHPTIDKVFPKIGLPNNCSGKIKSIKLKDVLRAVDQANVDGQFDGAVDGAVDAFTKGIRDWRYQVEDCLLGYQPFGYETEKGTYHEIDHKDKNVIGKINSYLHSQGEKGRIKRSIKIGDDDWRIVFSSDPWDIATMSMRGISSCQSWKASGTAKHGLIGSMIDEFCAVIFITDGTKTANGSKMMYRSVVRLLRSNGKKANWRLFLEGVYGGKQTDDGVAYQLFKDFLERKTKGKIPVSYGSGQHYIPMSKPVEELKKEIADQRAVGMHEAYARLSYSDNCIGYRAFKNLRLPSIGKGK